MFEINQKMENDYHDIMTRMKNGEVFDKQTMKFVRSYGDFLEPSRKREKSVQKVKRVRKQKVG